MNRTVDYAYTNGEDQTHAFVPGRHSYDWKKDQVDTELFERIKKIVKAYKMKSSGFTIWLRQ